MIKMKKLAVAVMIAAAVAAVPSTVSAGAMAGGSSEVTQIMNNVQLVLSYAKQVNMVSQQVKTYQAQLKQLKQLDPKKASDLLKGVQGVAAGVDIVKRINAIDELDGTLQGLSDKMNSLGREGKIAASTIDMLAQKGHKLDLDDYLGMMKALSDTKQAAYGERLKMLNSVAKDAQSDIERVNKIAAANAGIESDVQGFQAMLQSNAVMVSQLASLRGQLASSEKMSIEQAQILSKEAAKSDAAEIQAKTWKQEWWE